MRRESYCLIGTEFFGEDEKFLYTDSGDGYTAW